MQREYNIIDYSEFGMPFIEVKGDEYTYKDLYDLVGYNQFVVTFGFKVGSDAHMNYGDSVTGVIFYSKNALKKLENPTDNNINIDLSMLMVNSFDNHLSTKTRNDLKYNGFKIADIYHLSYLPIKKQLELFDTGEKKIPNIIEIEVDCAALNPDVLCRSYLVGKNNSDNNLIFYEKEKLIGITLGINGGHIDSRILNDFGFTEQSIKENPNILFYMYRTKQRKGLLTEIEQKKYAEICEELRVEKMLKLANEVIKSGVNGKFLKENPQIFDPIKEALESFSFDILLHGKKQIYWDVDSYVHIVMRHMADFQLGNYKAKTPLPYKLKDLKILIEKVLASIRAEYQDSMFNDPTKEFRRSNEWAIPFNGDLYHLRIDPNGRLIQFHSV